MNDTDRHAPDAIEVRARSGFYMADEVDGNTKAR